MSSILQDIERMKIDFNVSREVWENTPVVDRDTMAPHIYSLQKKAQVIFYQAYRLVVGVNWHDQPPRGDGWSHSYDEVAKILNLAIKLAKLQPFA